MISPEKITPRNLGHLEVEDVCLADFWWLSRMGFHPPFDNFGAAIFHDCQSMQEAMIGHYLDRDGCLPDEFAPFCDIKERIDISKHWSHYGYWHKSGIWLYGSPDEVMRRKDNTGVIWDHKTAHPRHADADDSKSADRRKKKVDRFRPMYDVQVTGYALIGEVGKKLGRFSAGALCYWDIQHQSVIAEPSKFIKNGQLWTAFKPVIYEVELDYSRIDRLLTEAKKIWKSKVPPEGRKGCKDCKKLAALNALQMLVENEISVRDRRALSMSGNDPWVVRMIGNRLRDRMESRLSALHELRDAGESSTFDDDGMAANWEFFR